MRFDLSSSRNLRGAQSRRQVLWAGRGLVVVFIIVGVVGLSYGYYSHHGFSDWIPGLGLLVAVCVMMIGFGTLFIRTARTVASTVDVDARGFAFDFGDGRPWKGAWSDPRLRLQVVRFTETDGGHPSLLAAGSSSERAYLTPEALAELVRQASSSGLRIVETEAPRNPFATILTFSR